MARLCSAAGVAGADTASFVDCVLELRRFLGIPHTLSELGMDDADAREIARRALKDPSAAGNAFPLSAADLENLFRAAVDGDTRRLQSRPQH